MPLPLPNEERFWNHTLYLSASCNRIYFVILFSGFFHVKVFTGKLLDCNLNAKAPEGNTFLLLILLLLSFMWQFCCSLACRMHIHYTKKITPTSHPTSTDLTAPALWKAERHALLCHMATSVLQ